MIEEIIIAGFGGQGILFTGRVIAQAGMLEDKHVTWMPSYGPEMRGGTANCAVVISSEEIGSPIVPEPDSALVMNNPSLEKFLPLVKSDGFFIINSSLAGDCSKRDDIETFEIEATELAEDLGDIRVANMIMLGAFIVCKEIVHIDNIQDALKQLLSSSGKKRMLNINKKALEKGIEIGRNGKLG